MRAKLARAVVGWRVIASVDDGQGGVALKPISRTFNVRQAAEQHAELARPQYPDAYIQAVEKIDRIQAGILVSDKV